MRIDKSIFLNILSLYLIALLCVYTYLNSNSGFNITQSPCKLSAITLHIKLNVLFVLFYKREGYTYY